MQTNATGHITMSDDELIASPAPPAEPETEARTKRLPPPWRQSPDQVEFARHIARQLQEADWGLIGSVIQILGAEVVQTLLQETLDIEAQGGWMLADNSRRRTTSGVFLVLAKQRMTRDEQKYLRGLPRAMFPRNNRPKGSLKAFDWPQRRHLLAPLRKQHGSATTVKAVLVGRPTTITQQPTHVILTLTHPPKAQSLPRGLPTPGPELLSDYTVYVAAKQWKKVAAALADPEDVLIIEGLCTFNEPLGGMAVYATSVTTHNLQVIQRAQKQ
jgi:hypothetical protein